MQYTEKVMQHFMHPHNVGVIENPDGYGKVGNPSCGDIMEIFIKVDNNYYIISGECSPGRRASEILLVKELI